MTKEQRNNPKANGKYKSDTLSNMVAGHRSEIVPGHSLYLGLPLIERRSWLLRYPLVIRVLLCFDGQIIVIFFYSAYPFP